MKLQFPNSKSQKKSTVSLSLSKTQITNQKVSTVSLTLSKTQIVVINYISYFVFRISYFVNQNCDTFANAKDFKMNWNSKGNQNTQ